MSFPEALASAVRDRRRVLGDLTQAQIATRGGPSTETLRLIEHARQPRFGDRTLGRLDRALEWKPGTSQKILDGIAAAEELDVRWPSTGTPVQPIQSDSAEAASARVTEPDPPHQSLSIADQSVGIKYRRRGGVSVGELMKRAEDGDPEAVEALRPIVSAAQAVATSALRPTLDAVAEALQPATSMLNAIASISIRPMFDDVHSGMMRSFAHDVAPSMTGIAELLNDVTGPNSALAAIRGVVESLQLPENSFKLATADLGRFSIDSQLIDVSSSLGLPESVRALAIPPVSQERMAMWEEFERKSDAIAAESWADEEDLTIEEALRRYNEAHPNEAPDRCPAKDGGAAEGDDPTETDPDDGIAPAIVEVLPGRWGAVFVAQQDVSDAKDTALAAELLARVARRAPSDERSTQLRVLNSLFEDLLDEEQQSQRLAPRPDHMRRLEQMRQPR